MKNYITFIYIYFRSYAIQPIICTEYPLRYRHVTGQLGGWGRETLASPSTREATCWRRRRIHIKGTAE